LGSRNDENNIEVRYGLREGFGMLVNVWWENIGEEGK
jgi:hypothetical protein